MKKNISFVLLAIVALFANATDRFYITDFSISPGETRTISINLDNEIAYTAFQSDLILPEGLSVDEESFALTERKNSNHVLTISAFSESAYRLMSYSLKLKSYIGNSGALVTFDITASDSFVAPAVITLCNTLFTTEEGVEVPFANEECQVTLGLRGDVNCDGFVNMDDLTTMINYLLTDNAEGISLTNADVNHSGGVSMDDLTTLINFMLTDQWPIDPEEPVEPEGTQTITVNGVSFKMVPVESGTFMMGATAEQGDDAYNDEKPVHEVTLSSFYIGQTEVTQALWQAVMGSNPSYFADDPNRPVEMVSWNDCQEFITQLNQMTGKQFRMPTEAEWEYAARGGNKSEGYKYSGSNDIDAVAWYEDNSDAMSHVVATKAPNELGIYDMTGNVWEWVQDWYARYSAEAQIDPTGPETGTQRVFRGGSWYSSARLGRVSYRDVENMTNSYNRLGLRLVLDNPEI